MDYTTLRDLLQRDQAKVLSIEKEGMGFGADVVILVDNKHQYKVHISGAQLLALESAGKASTDEAKNFNN